MRLFSISPSVLLVLGSIIRSRLPSFKNATSLCNLSLSAGERLGRANSACFIFTNLSWSQTRFSKLSSNLGSTSFNIGSPNFGFFSMSAIFAWPLLIASAHCCAFLAVTRLLYVSSSSPVTLSHQLRSSFRPANFAIRDSSSWTPTDVSSCFFNLASSSPLKPFLAASILIIRSRSASDIFLYWSNTFGASGWLLSLFLFLLGLPHSVGSRYW